MSGYANLMSRLGPPRSCWPDAQRALTVDLQHAEAKEFMTRLSRCTAEDWMSKDPSRQCLETCIDMLDQHGEIRLRIDVRLKQPVRDTEVYTRQADRHVVLHSVVRAKPAAGSDEILSEMATCSLTCGRNVLQNLNKAFTSGFQTLAGLLDSAHRSLDFYTWQLRGISDTEELKDYTCSICLGSADALADLVMLQCSHVFHRSCVVRALQQQGRCPQCRQQASGRTMSSVLLELQEAPEPERRLEQLTPELRKHGSKLHAIAQCLRNIRADDPTAKAIVFVQWQELEDRVAAALQTHQLPAERLPRGRNKGREMSTIMKRFCTAPDCFVLLLSLDNVASGTNLTEASHVFFVHPMNADTLSTAVAYEKQALARVRRVGQMRSEVHVWRFVTRHTVEEHIHDLHQRQQGAAEAA